MKIRVAYIISNIDKALAFEWIASKIDNNRFELLFILLNQQESSLEIFLRDRNIAVERVIYNGKYNIIHAFFKIRRILNFTNIQVVHTHLFDASLIGLLAAKSLGISKRIHTRHNSTIHHRYFPRAVIYDRIINSLSTHIVAISHVVKRVLIEMEGVKPSKIELIHHGFDFSIIPESSSERISVLRRKYLLKSHFPIIGVISRYIHWKGIQYIIPAFRQLLMKYPESKLILANARGPFQAEIHRLLGDLPSDTYLEIEFEVDIFSLYKLFDVFVHSPIDGFCEAFGQVYIEAMASGIPSVFTASGIAQDIIVHEENAILVDFENSEEIEQAIVKILGDTELRKKLIINSQKDVINSFDLMIMISNLENLYID